MDQLRCYEVAEKMPSKSNKIQAARGKSDPKVRLGAMPQSGLKGGLRGSFLSPPHVVSGEWTL